MDTVNSEASALGTDSITSIARTIVRRAGLALG
jgi:hypothetical protein